MFDITVYEARNIHLIGEIINVEKPLFNFKILIFKIKKNS